MRHNLIRAGALCAGLAASGAQGATVEIDITGVIDLVVCQTASCISTPLDSYSGLPFEIGLVYDDSLIETSVSTNLEVLLPGASSRAEVPDIGYLTEPDSALFYGTALDLQLLMFGERNIELSFAPGDTAIPGFEGGYSPIAGEYIPYYLVHSTPATFRTISPGSDVDVVASIEDVRVRIDGAEITEDTPIPPVPLPAPALPLLAGVGLLAALRRR